MVVPLDGKPIHQSGKLTKAVLLDINGMATETPVTVKLADGKLTVELPSQTTYVVLM